MISNIIKTSQDIKMEFYSDVKFYINAKIK